MSEALSKDVPPYYIVFLIVNGFFFSILSPLIIFLRTQIWINPFNKMPTESVSSILFLLLFAFIAGLPGVLFRDYITGNNGPIAVLRRRHRGEKWRIKYESPDACHSIEYFFWIKNNGIGGYLSFMNIRFALANGFLLGSGLALMVNIPVIPVLLLVLEDKFFLILVLICSLIFSLIAFIYEKYFFRKGYNEIMLELDKRYKESQLKERLRNCQF